MDTPATGGHGLDPCPEQVGDAAAVTASRVDRLFRVTHGAGAPEQSYSDVAAALTTATATTVTADDVEQLRAGTRTADARELESLADFFGISATYLLCTDPAPAIDEQLHALEVLRDSQISIGCVRGGPMPAGTLIAMLEHIQADNTERAAAARSRPTPTTSSPPTPAYAVPARRRDALALTHQTRRAFTAHGRELSLPDRAMVFLSFALGGGRRDDQASLAVWRIISWPRLAAVFVAVIAVAPLCLAAAPVWAIAPIAIAFLLALVAFALRHTPPRAGIAAGEHLISNVASVGRPGAGARLLEAVCDEADRHGRTLALRVDPQRSALTALYRGAGFRPVREHRGLLTMRRQPHGDR